MNLHPIEISETASSGGWSFNTDTISGGICHQIYVKATTATTTFNIKLKDEKGNYVYDTTGEDTATGTLNAMDLGLPMRGRYTVYCTDSSADEAFTGRILVED